MKKQKKDKKQEDFEIPDWFKKECAYICGENPDTFELF